MKLIRFLIISLYFSVPFWFGCNGICYFIGHHSVSFLFAWVAFSFTILFISLIVLVCDDGPSGHRPNVGLENEILRRL